MKEFLLQMMLAMMPAMKTMTLIGLALALLAIITALLIKFTGKVIPLWASRIAMILGVFFLIAHPMGLFLGMNPSINFGNADEFEFILYPFWQIGLIIFVPAFIAWLVARR
jgi:hypothetical protein